MPRAEKSLKAVWGVMGLRGLCEGCVGSLISVGCLRRLRGVWG